MTDVTGIFAKIRMTNEAKSKFYKEKRKALLTDYFCIQHAFKNSKRYYLEMDEVSKRQKSDNAMSVNEYIEVTNQLNKKYLTQNSKCDAEDLLVIRYDVETASLFYFQMFRWNDVDNLKTSISLQAFLRSVSKYKDIDNEDLIFFSNCATCLLESQFYKIWSVTKNHIKELDLNSWSNSWNNSLEGVDKLSKKYYFDIVDRHITNNEGYYEIDEDGLDQELESNMIDNELIGN
jgi:hypothetical protein